MTKWWESAIRMSETDPELLVTQYSAWWWVWISLGIGEWVLDHLPHWEVPLVGRLRIKRDGEFYTIEEYYGSCVGCWGCHLWNSWSQPLYRRVRELGSLTMPLAQAVEKWGPDSPLWWKEELTHCQTSRTDAAVPEVAS